ncbi:WAT1-related protein At2g39510-like isoform X2 [Tasmannia lanceolata]|uniref:WAT1-related protein At2g39510-like isoform X2 n=1 Tax=Tasmannia lanceolata TaxID=3420 RepID=UPI004064798D
MERERGSGPLFMFLNKMKPYMAVISMQFGYAGMNIISVIALNQGMSHYTLVVYRHIVAIAVIAPFALVFERNVRPTMTLSTFLKIMALGLLEPVLDQNIYNAGMKCTSATFTSAMSNVLPAITFLMAYFLSQAKVAGTAVTIAGAMVMTLYKGPIIEMVWSKGRGPHGPKTDIGEKDWIKGPLMLLTACFCWASFIILQAITLRTYPAELSLAALICLSGAFQGAIVALVIKHGNYAIWAIAWDAKLATAIYGGIVCSGMGYCVQGMVMKTRGPVFVTAFSPLSMVITTVLGSCILAEEITLGRVLGAIIIVAGLYSVVWGKSKDQMISSPSEPTEVIRDDEQTHSDEFLTIDVPTAEIPPPTTPSN